MEPLSAEEARVLGCLVEKQMTTPDYYPMTTNALVAACNQRTSRDPVVDYDEASVEQALRSLEDRGLVGMTRSSGGRAIKYAHKADDVLEVDSEQLALVAVLALRGPQTPGELRQRTDRYVSFPSVAAVEERLVDLMQRDEPLVTRLPREPGRKEHRYACVLTGADEPPTAPPSSPAPETTNADLADRVAHLERRVATLERLIGETGDA